MVFQSGIRVRLLTASPIRRGFLRTRLLLAAPKPWESASLAVLRPRSLGRPRRLGRRPRHLALLSPLARVLDRSEEHTSELQSQSNLVCRLLLEKKKRA